MLRFGKLRNKVVETGASAAEQMNRNVVRAGERGSEAARGAYGYVMNHPKTATAVVLGTGVAAALLWMARRNGGYSETRRQVLARVRSAGQSSKEKAQEFAHSE